MGADGWYCVSLKIIICDKCGGKGWTYDRTGAYDGGFEPCGKCDGSGRLEEAVNRRIFKGGWPNVD